MSHKKNIGKQWWPRSDATERGVWLGSTLFAWSTGISIIIENNKNKTDTLYIQNGLSENRVHWGR